MREAGQTPKQAADYLDRRLRRACDDHEARSKPRWSLADITAIRTLLDDRVREFAAGQQR